MDGGVAPSSMSLEDWVYAKQWFSSKEYPPLPAPRVGGHLAMSGDVFGCLNWGEGFQRHLVSRG